MADRGSVLIPAVVVGLMAAIMAPGGIGGSGDPSPRSSGTSRSEVERTTDAADGEAGGAGGAGGGGSGGTVAVTAQRPARVEGVDPETTVCADTARTVQGKNAATGGKVYARVELRYSPVCRAAWVRTRGSAGEPGRNPVATWGRVVRTSDGLRRASEHCSNVVCWSDMVDVAGKPAYAEGGFAFAGVDVAVRTRPY